MATRQTKIPAKGTETAPGVALGNKYFARQTKIPAKGTKTFELILNSILEKLAKPKSPPRGLKPTPWTVVDINNLLIQM